MKRRNFLSLAALLPFGGLLGKEVVTCNNMCGEEGPQIVFNGT